MNILISNVHSALNLGDDAIMQTTLDSLTRAFPGAKITIAANDPVSWQKYTGVTVVGSLTSWVIYTHVGHWRARVVAIPFYLGLLIVALVGYRLCKIRVLFGSKEQRSLLGAYYDADLVLSCGGGNFYAHRWISPFFILALVSLGFALGLGKRVIMLPQSIGPIRGKLQRRLAGQIFNQVALIMHRDRRSLDFATQNQVRVPGILVPDLAFGFPPVMVSSQNHRGHTLQIGVTITGRIAQRAPARQEIYESILETVLVRLNQTHSAQLHIFVQCYGPDLVHDDRLAAQRLYERLRHYTDQVHLRERFYNAMSLRSGYAQMDCMIGTRMHTAIFAASSGVPIVLIGYQPKAFGLMDLLGVSEYSCDIETLTAEQLFEVTSRALQHRERIHQHLIARYSELHAQLDNWTCWLGLE